MDEKKNFKFRDTALGILLIVLALCMLLSKTEIFHNIPVLKIGLCFVIAMKFMESMRRVNFLGMSVSLGVAVCLFQGELGLGEVNFIIILMAFTLIGVGLSMIFKRKGMLAYDTRTNDDYFREENGADTGCFKIENCMGTKTEYLQIKNLHSGKISNSLGNMSVYFNGTTVSEEGAIIKVENGAGQLSVYFPKEFRAGFRSTNGLGKIDIHGRGSVEADQPLVNVNVDNGLGKIDFYFI